MYSGRRSPVALKSFFSSGEPCIQHRFVSLYCMQPFGQAGGFTLQQAFGFLQGKPPPPALSADAVS